MMEKGPVAGFPVVNLKFVLDDGTYHDVDSSDMAFMLTAQELIREQFSKMKPALLEPVMLAEIECPESFQGSVVGNLASRRGMVTSTDVQEGVCTHSGRDSAGGDLRILNRSPQHDAGPGHLHYGACPSTSRCQSSIQEEIVAERKAELQPA